MIHAKTSQVASPSAQRSATPLLSVTTRLDAKRDARRPATYVLQHQALPVLQLQPQQAAYQVESHPLGCFLSKERLADDRFGESRALLRIFWPA